MATTTLLSPPPSSTLPPPSPPSKPPTLRTHLHNLCKQGQPDTAHRLLQSLPKPPTLLYNTIIIGYICNNNPHKALHIYSQMLPTSKPDPYTYSSVLKACAETQQLHTGKIIHARILRSHAKITGIVSNSLLNMYSTCFVNDFSVVDKVFNEMPKRNVVEKVFDEMPKRNVVAWNTMIAWYVKGTRFSEVVMCFVRMIKLGIKPSVVSFVNVFPAVGGKYADVVYGLLVKCGKDYVNDCFAVSSAISMYSEINNMDVARKVFDTAVNKNIEVWNTMIGGYVQNDCHCEALRLLEDLMSGVEEVVDPDIVTFLASFTAVSYLQWIELGQQLHACVVKNSMVVQVIVLNSLISMYSKCNLVEIGFKVFEKMVERDIVSWNTMVSGFVQNGFDDQGLMLVREMMRQRVSMDSISATALLSAASNLRNSELGKQTHAYVYRHGVRFEGMDSYLVDMYAKSGLIDVAKRVFDNQCVHTRDHVTWNAMIAGYTQNGKTEQAFTVLRQMLVQKETPSSVTLASVLPACIPVGGISFGKQIHGFAMRRLLDNNVFVSTALIDIYSKCASISCAEKIYNSAHEKNSVTYTTMILGYGQHGLGERAMQIFRKMCEAGSIYPPDTITFVSILSACSYCGMVDQGLEIFESMERLYGIVPSAEHYSCVVDMLGRAGRVVEAYEFVQELGEKGNVAGIWGSLLGACRIHGKLELGRIIAERVFDMGKKMDVTGYRVLMSNIYADKEMWDSANRVRKDMRDKGLRQVAGCSWIDVGGSVNCFTSRDQKHPYRDAIYAKLEELAADMSGFNWQIGSYIMPVTMNAGGNIQSNPSPENVVVYVGFEHECSHGHRFLLNPRHLEKLGPLYSLLEDSPEKGVESLNSSKRGARENVVTAAQNARMSGRSRQATVHNEGGDGFNLLSASKNERDQSSLSTSVNGLSEGLQYASLDDGGCASALLNMNLPLYMNCPHCMNSKKDQQKLKFADSVSQLQRIFLVTPPFPTVLGMCPVVQFEDSCLPPSVVDREVQSKFSVGCRVILPPDSFLSFRLPFVYGVQLEDKSLHPLKPLEHQPELTAWIAKGTTLQVVSNESSLNEYNTQKV